MRNFQIVKLRPAKHVIDNRLGGMHPFSRPPQDGQGNRPPGRIVVDTSGSGHAVVGSIQRASYIESVVGIVATSS